MRPHDERATMCAGEPVGRPKHGTGYQDRVGFWTNGWLRRYPDAKPHNRMSRHALRARGAFHVLREMPSARKHVYTVDSDSTLTRYAVPMTTQYAQAQAVRVLMHVMHWLNERRGA